MISAGIGAGIGRSGALGVGANQFSSMQPSIFFGKGFGDVPSGLSWLRPFAITGVATLEVPTSHTSTNLDNSVAGELTPILTRSNTIVHWGLSIQYSTFYLTPRFSPGRLPNDEPLNQLIPVVEFAFDTPIGGAPVATMNPGMVYVADTFQVGAELVFPLNSGAGHSVGVRAQLLLFTDALLPNLFGKPLFGH
jgi:hypothetical protein